MSSQNSSVRTRHLQAISSPPFLTALFWIGLLITSTGKLFQLHSRELWLDETYSAYVATHSISQILRATTGDINPPLFHLVLHAWVRLAGDSASHLRLFSVILSTLCTAILWFLAKRILGPVYGALAALLFALSPMLFVYSFEVRSYALLILVTTIVIGVHWRVVVEKSSSKRMLIAYASGLATLVYIHYLSLFVLAGLALHALWFAFRNRELFTRIGLVTGVVLIFLIPGIRLLDIQRANAAKAHQVEAQADQNPEALTYQIAETRHQEAAAKRKVLPKNYAAMLGFYPATSKLVLLLTTLPVVIAVGCIFYFGFVQQDPLCLLLLIVGTCLTLGILAFKAYGTRYLLPLVPLLVLALARIIQRIAARPSRRSRAAVLATALVAIYSAGYIRQATRPHARPWQSAVAAIRSAYTPGDPIIFDAGYSQVPFDYFAHHQNFAPLEWGFPESIYQWWQEQDTVTGWGGPVIYHSKLESYVNRVLTSGHKTYWIVSYESFYVDPYDEFLKRLASSGELSEVPLPPDPDARPEEGSGMRLLRFSPAAGKHPDNAAK